MYTLNSISFSFTFNKVFIAVTGTGTAALVFSATGTAEGFAVIPRQEQCPEVFSIFS